MDILALVAVALLQLAALTFEQLQETVNAIEAALVEQYVEPVAHASKEKGPAM